MFSSDTRDSPRLWRAGHRGEDQVHQLSLWCCKAQPTYLCGFWTSATARPRLQGATANTHTVPIRVTEHAANEDSKRSRSNHRKPACPRCSQAAESLQELNIQRLSAPSTRLSLSALLGVGEQQVGLTKSFHLAVSENASQYAVRWSWKIVRNQRGEDVISVQIVVLRKVHLIY